MNPGTPVRFSELVDVARLRTLMDSFNRVLGVANAVIDVKGDIIAQAGWQDVCQKFHRADARTCARCIESDTALVESTTRGVPYAVYDCLNGLVDTASPITIDGQHVANVFTGQVFTAPPDLEGFRAQARTFGFDEEAYLEAVRRVPVVPRDRLEVISRLYAALATTLGQNGADRLHQRESAQTLNQLNQELEQRVAARTAALTASETRARALLDASPVPLAVVDPAGKVVTANREFTRLFGYTLDDVPTLDDWWRLAYPDPAYRQSVISAWAGNAGEAMRTGGPVPAQEARVRCKDGSDRTCLISGNVMVMPDGGALLVMLTDISERVNAEAARTALEGQLRESQKMEALGTLAGGIAHDFNNLLMAIMGNVDLARDEAASSPGALRCLGEIDRASQRARLLVQQILAFSRRQAVDRRATSLTQVVADTAALLRASVPAGTQLTVQCDSTTPLVFADPTQLAQVLLNLCSNAASAVRDLERPGVIEVRVGPADHDRAGPGATAGRFASLVVRDNGVGMDAATRAHIFEPFFTTRPRGAGTGLGLSVVHGIVQSHGGVIEVETTPGVGSTFRVTFPAMEAPPAVPPPETTAPPQARATATASQARVLLVDDEVALTSLLTRLLGERGYRVTAFSDSAEALAAATRTPGAFDVAVVDFNMPGLSGLELTRGLKALRPDLKVLLLTGDVAEQLRREAPDAGVDRLVDKPVTMTELCAALEQCLAARP